MSTLPNTATQNDLTHDLMGREQTPLVRFSTLETFEVLLLEEQKTWDEPGVVKRVIALHNVEARVSLTSEAADGLVRVELQNRSRETGVSGTSTMPKARLNESHDRLLNFLEHRRQSWDTGELVAALNLSRSFINRLGKDLAEHDLIDFVRTERRTINSMRAKRRPA